MTLPFPAPEASGGTAGAAPPGPPPPARPWSVRAATGLLLMAALLLVVALPGYGYDLAHVNAVADRAAAAVGASATDARSVASAETTSDAFAMVVTGLYALLLLACARGIRQPAEVARIAALATCGALLLCCTATLGANTLPVPAERAELTQRMASLQDATYPSWTNLTGDLLLGLYPVLLAALVLLLVPASNRYFRPNYVAYLVPLPEPPGGLRAAHRRSKG